MTSTTITSSILTTTHHPLGTFGPPTGVAPLIEGIPIPPFSLSSHLVPSSFNKRQALKGPYVSVPGSITCKLPMQPLAALIFVFFWSYCAALALPPADQWILKSRARLDLAAQDTQHPLRSAEAEPSGWHNPANGGGRMLDLIHSFEQYTTPRYGEPLNVIISGASHPSVLTHKGLHRYAKSIGFSEECLGLHIGKIHTADLGDGEGRKDEQFLGRFMPLFFPTAMFIGVWWVLARQHYFPIWGTCWESLAGGNHFRAWQQKDTGAWFLAVSKEKYVGDNHQIIENGYNIGRDYLVSKAVRNGARLEWRDDLLEAGNDEINHGIEQDGRVAVLTINYAP
ncbi:hypothetical protein CTheo_699 [Ceratobasidium theobromae]|uniref:Transmembrane protein n=1 Tax=Ceratobasidium theobromae TaxID=1582974 RepID=A0A5N5QW11_9AGAM|nr:hypothetical protein CTheo_699 [Ceratobasidium theobromae]